MNNNEIKTLPQLYRAIEQATDRQEVKQLIKLAERLSRVRADETSKYLPN
jgi:hypothetical protein